MFRYLAILGFLCLACSLNAQTKGNKSRSAAGNKLTPGAALLFNGVKSKLSVAEKNRLYQKFNLKLSPDRKGFFIDEFSVDTYVFPTDMNKDGREELFIGLGSTALFGDVAESFFLYMKDNSGDFQQQPEIIGGRPLILSAGNPGYPDILMGGSGPEHTVYRWDGHAYAFHRKASRDTLNNGNSTDIESYSGSFNRGRRR